MSDIGITGAEDLERLARRLKATGGTDLRKELLRGMREVGKPAIVKIRKSAAESLPRRGGLAAVVAGSKFSTRSKLAGKSVGVRIEGRSGHDIEAMDKGILRHPVFGRGGWAVQSVTPGWFTKPAEDSLSTAREGIQKVMADIAKKIEESV